MPPAGAGTDLHLGSLLCGRAGLPGCDLRRRQGCLQSPQRTKSGRRVLPGHPAAARAHRLQLDPPTDMVGEGSRCLPPSTHTPSHPRLIDIRTLRSTAWALGKAFWAHRGELGAGCWAHDGCPTSQTTASLGRLHISQLWVKGKQAARPVPYSRPWAASRHKAEPEWYTAGA